MTHVLTDRGGWVDKLRTELALPVGAGIEWHRFTVGTEYPLLVPYQHTGWRYLVVPNSDHADRSPASYPDSAWSEGRAPFGANDVDTGTNAAVQAGAPGWVTPWTPNTTLWVRRGGLLPASRVVLRVANSCVIYWNGVPVAEQPAAGGRVAFTIPAAVNLSAGNVLAVRAADDGGWSYFDAEVYGVEQ